MLNVRFDAASVAKIERLIRRIERAQAYGDDRKKLTTAMRDKQAKTWVQNFPKGGRYGGYKKLNPQTVSNRLARGFAAGPPLIRSGLLQRVVGRQSHEGRPTNDGVFWNFYNYPFGSDVGVYPIYHNQGTTSIPARKFWDLNGQDLQMHEKRAEQWLGELGRIIVSGR